jgi:hypothetical protein
MTAAELEQFERERLGHNHNSLLFTHLDFAAVGYRS